MTAPADAQPEKPRGGRPQTCRMFETPLLEHFSRIHPATPFLFWVPVLVFVLGRSLVSSAEGAEGALGLAAHAPLVLAGVLVWTLAEYLLHRFVFHAVGARPWQRRLYFVAHGVHHDFPQDRDRLVMPLGVSIPIGFGFFALFRLFFGPVVAAPLFVGFGLGYLAYDGLHYAVHHFRLRSRAGRWLKRYHMVHHHTGENARWGVSSPLWDWVFGTMGARGPASGPARATERA